MPRFLTAFLLLTAFAAQTFSRAVIVLDYYVNTASFAKHCENKARPLLHCNGKCQMMKKLKEEEKKESRNPERKTDGKDQTLSSRSFFTTALCPAPCTRPAFTGLRPKRPTDRAYAIFHPPALV